MARAEVDERWRGSRSNSRASPLNGNLLHFVRLDSTRVPASCCCSVAAIVVAVVATAAARVCVVN